MVGLGTELRAGMVVAAALALLVVWALARPLNRRRLRSRLLVGVPWGSLVAVGVVLAVYVGLQQQGHVERYDPLYLPFVSWSYRYPLGMVTAPFSHRSFGHLRGNLLATATLAPLAEYAFAHFPTERGSSSFASWRSNPYVRAFVVFPLGVVLVGLATSYLHWGPIVGFSGVVFAFAGFALVRYPLAAALALVADQFLGLALGAFRDPVTTAEAGVQFTRPSWAEVAVLGHFVGLLLGALAGALLFRRRESLPSAPRLAVGALLVGTLTDLWAVWWYSGPASYVLYRAVGVGVVALAAAAVALVVRASDRPLVEGISRRRAATALFVLPLMVVAFVAVPVNYTAVSPGSTPNPDGAVSVRGYDVTYAEGVPNQRISVVNWSVLGASTNVEASGFIVVDADRELWTQAASPGELDANRFAVVDVGGVGWRRDVYAVRTGWNVAGNGSVYRVWLRAAGGEWVRSFDSDPRTARPVVAGRNVTLFHRDGVGRPNATADFGVRVTAGNRTIGVGPLPPSGGTVTVGGVRLRRDGRTLLALRNGTRVRVASREQAA